MKATDQIEFKALNNVIDKVREFDERHGWIDYFIAPVLVTIILLTVYAIKGVYPFGLNTIAYYDMPTNGMASYSWLYDVMHGETGFFLKWNSGLATPGFLNNLFLPVNWFFFFVKRDGIIFAISFYLMIKLELIAFCMSFYLKKHFGNSISTICLSTLYTFCGFVIQYYTNIDFLDLVIMLPLIVFALERLLSKHKYIFFVVLLFLVFMCNIQMAFMMCIYIVFKAYFILKTVPDEKKGQSIRLFALSIIFAALIAGFVLFPTILSLMNSVRVQKGASGIDGEFNYFEKMKLIYNYFRRNKEFMLYGSEIAFGMLLLIILRGKRVALKYTDNIKMIFILAIPIIHEGINILWHLGSYKHFPIRFGYMLTFECLAMVAKYVNEEEFINIKYISRMSKILVVAALPFIGIVLFKFCSEFKKTGIQDMSPYHTYWLYFITLSGLFFAIFLIDSQTVRSVTLLIVVLIQCFCGCYGLIAPETAEFDKKRIKYVFNSLQLRKEFGDNANTIDRVKLDPLYYDANAANIIGQPTISYWSNGVNPKTEEELQNNMDYDGMATCVLDSGGTVFSDALLGVKYAASLDELDEVLYSKKEGVESIYNAKYVIPFGIVVDKEELNNDKESFEHQNYLFKNITGSDETLISVISAEELVDDVKDMTDEEVKKLNISFAEHGPKDAYEINYDSSSSEITDNSEKDQNSNERIMLKEKQENDDRILTKEYILNISSPERSIIYLTTSESFDNEMMIVVNGNYKFMNSFQYYGNFKYPNDLANGIIELDSSPNEDMKLSIYTTNNDLNGVQIGILNLDTLKKGIDEIEKNQELDIECGKNSMHVTGAVRKSGTLFFPVGYSDNWHAQMNGKRVEVRPYINDAFIGVNVTDGNVDLEFTYIPKGLPSGVVISFLGILLVALLGYFEKRGGLSDKKCEPVVDKVFIYGFNSFVAIMFIVMYVVPIWIKMSL